MLGIKKGGVHPHDEKQSTEGKKIEYLPVSPKLYIPIRQHIGEPCAPVVKVGDLVKKGQVIADSPDGKAAPVHSSTSGKVVEIGNYPHPVYGLSTCIVIESDGQDEWMEGLLVERDYNKLSKKEIIDIIFRSGIVGMGGAAFPTHIKLSPPEDRKIDTLIVNGAECEPYLTSDYRTMIEFADDVIKGTLIAMKILNVENCYIGIEHNKPEAIKLLTEKCKGTNIKVVTLETRYPQGAEKMMINVITGREVPSGRLPMDVGCVVQNVGTLKAVADAVEKGIPLIERIVTVAGKTVKDPKNLMVRIGTPFKDLFDYCGGFTDKNGKVIMGGPMMGLAQVTLDAVVIKATSGIVSISEKDVDYQPEKACIRCGRCIEACTMRLRPSILSILSEKGLHQTAQTDYDLNDCVECGCCYYVCPSRRNIVHYIRQSKAKNAMLRAAAKTGSK
ncbi:MAG TPA: electron transport complex subunit RsxC [Spirochaetota bacterium]|jgi:electron transport complex protein RnfC|nr:electron transport complex subunit RsxC [Spirochaetota bacterium]HPD78915.1 electron transport complex subunit RsxC [Spirochaetota bacterium]HRU66648.1 electron transport complex subunit RsxC [Spirochaetota bacterium]